MNAIVVSHLAKSFGTFKAVDDISFVVPQGRIVALLGSNGAGKTTTLMMLLGLTTPSAGRADVLGHNMAHARYEALSFMNFSSPYVDLPPSLTAYENLYVYGHLYGIAQVKERIHALAEELSFKDFLTKKFGALSAGQKTRVTLAKALMNQPRVLLLDEPTASLDPDSADFVRSYLLKMRDETGATLFMASHNMQEVERMADDVLMMKTGRIVAQGSPSALCAAHHANTLEDVFLRLQRERQTA